MPLTTTDQIAVIAAGLTGLGVIAAVLTSSLTLRQNNHYQRAQWLMTTTLQLHNDKRLSLIFDEIQYERFAFQTTPGEGCDLRTPKEVELIYWLDFLNSISDAVDEGLLKVKHLRSCTLGYAIEMTLKNRNIQQYLRHVASYDRGRGSPLLSWGLLRHRENQSFSYLRKMKRRLDMH